jgi:hypothetical protein
MTGRNLREPALDNYVRARPGRGKRPAGFGNAYARL